MGKRNRRIKLTNEWLNNYAKEATGIIISLVAEARKGMILLPGPLLTRIARLEAASTIWDAINKKENI